MSKPILCLDFDGVIHSYTSGWSGPASVCDPPVDGALEFLEEATGHFTVHIFSSRSNQQHGTLAMAEWLVIHGWPRARIAWKDILLSRPALEDQEEARVSRVLAEVALEKADEGKPALDVLRFPIEKPPAFLTIDDRAITFYGTFPQAESLLEFKPWNKR